MGMTDKELKSYFQKKADIVCCEEKIQETVRRSGETLGEAQAGQTLSRAEFLYQQSRYIRKRWWIFQGILLFLLWMFLGSGSGSYYMRRSIGVATPLFVILLIPEIWKNRSANSMEVEGSAYYSLRQIYAARMVLFALADLVLISLFFAGVFWMGRIPVAEMTVQFFIPFNVSCCICFCTLYSPWARADLLSLLLCMVWSLVWVQIVLTDRIYKAITAPMWAGLLAVSFLCLIYSILRSQKKCQQIWEGNTVWN